MGGGGSRCARGTNIWGKRACLRCKSIYYLAWPNGRRPVATRHARWTGYSRVYVSSVVIGGPFFPKVCCACSVVTLLYYYFFSDMFYRQKLNSNLNHTRRKKALLTQCSFCCPRRSWKKISFRDVVKLVFGHTKVGVTFPRRKRTYAAPSQSNSCEPSSLSFLFNLDCPRCARMRERSHHHQLCPVHLGDLEKNPVPNLILLSSYKTLSIKL